jgi:hypothetical protein
MLLRAAAAAAAGGLTVKCTGVEPRSAAVADAL